MDHPDADRVLDGIDNNLSQAHPLRSRDNLYEYRDAPIKIVKSGHMSDATSLNSPSSLGAMNTMKIGSSQSSLPSAISMKGGGDSLSKSESEAQSDRSNIKISNKNLVYNANKSRSKEYLANKPSSPAAESTITTTTKSSSGKSTPIPGPRTALSKSRTHLIEGIPQTEV